MDMFHLSVESTRKSRLSYHETINAEDLDYSTMSLPELLHLLFYKTDSLKTLPKKEKIQNLCKFFPTFYLLGKASTPELVNAGLTLQEVSIFKASLELGKRFVKEESAPLVKIINSADVYRYLETPMSHLEQEQCVLLLLNTQNKIIKDIILSEGSVKEVSVNTLKIAEHAVRCHAASFIFIHNHPSGSSTPSLHDKHFTRKLVAYGELIQTPLLDHIIIGSAEYFSFLDEGLIKQYQETYLHNYENMFSHK